jgi:hypothetical protein
VHFPCRGLAHVTIAVTDSAECLPFPKHLRPFIPNAWGSLISAGQELHGMMEASIFMKGCVLLSTRGLLDEELFVDDSPDSVPLLEHNRSEVKSQE